MGIDKTGHHRGALGVDTFVRNRGLRSRTDPGDTTVLGQHRRIRQNRELVVTQRQLTDVVDQQATHASAIGILTPRSAATSSARSYPASTCRMTPEPGSFVNTLAIF